MSRQTATQRIAYYITNNHISVDQIEADLGIESGRLLYENGQELSASEFLELCRYLNVRPEELDDGSAGFIFKKAVREVVDKYGDGLKTNEKITMLAQIMAEIISDEKV